MASGTSTQNDTITYQYRFKFAGGEVRHAGISLDSGTLEIIPDRDVDSPAWAELSCCRCRHCPLDENEHTWCPIAVNMAGIVDLFGASVSHEEVEVEIETEARRYIKRTSLQRGLSSLLGIIMVTSGCPVMDKLRPMVRHHLPFATFEETVYHVLSMYLLAQYFRARSGQEPDWQLKGLTKLYRDIKKLNHSFCERLKQAGVQDASVNALIILNNFAELIPLTLNGKNLDDLGRLFQAYVD